MKAKLTRGLEEVKEYGKISRIKLPDKSRIYISKKGWSLVTPVMKGKKLETALDRLKENRTMEILIPYGEISLAIEETIAQGYIAKSKK